MFFSRNILWFSFLLGCQADTLFQGATIIAFDEESESLRIYRNASLLVENDLISSISEEPISVNSNVETIDATDRIITPGFIDTHHHMWQTAYKTIASNTTLTEYFQRYGEFGPATTEFTPEDIYLGQLTSGLEMLNDGTTSVLDHASGGFSDETHDQALAATFESGIRGFHAFAVHPQPQYPTEDQISLLRSYTQDPRFEESNYRVTLGLAYDTFFEPESAPEIAELWEIVTSNNLSVVTTHFVAGPWLSDNTPTLLHRAGWLNGSVPIVFSHASFMGAADAVLLRQTNQYVSTTPESEMHYIHGHPAIENIQDQAALGVDTHFTFGGSMVQQARLWLQTLRLRRGEEVLGRWAVPRRNPMSVNQAFYLITRAGGLALRRHDIGVIREGAKADLVVFDADSPGMLGWSDPVAAVILHSHTGDVEHVLVDGEFVKRDRRLVYSGYDDLKRRFRASAARIQQVWRETEFPPLEGDFAPSIPYADPLTVDTLRGNGTGY